MVAEIKQELQSEMGLLPVHLLRDRRASFVELYSYDNLGKTNYGTAGYLGSGYFITVKHAVVALQGRGRSAERAQDHVDQDRLPRQGDSGEGRRHRRRRRRSPQRRLGDHQDARELDLPALHVDTAFALRLRRIRSSGSATTTRRASSSRPATSGQRTSNGLVTCLTDGHPGVSGGGVLDQRGDLVGIPIGRMQGDYRFSFILPIRAEMLRKLPAYEQPEPLPPVRSSPSSSRRDGG